MNIHAIDWSHIPEDVEDLSLCPCKGEKAYSWHSRHQVPMCDAARKRRNEQRKALGINVGGRKPLTGARYIWTPGISVYEPDLDCD